jgi:flagellar hook protein FlgE
MSLSVIGNNIANINTIGFKTGRALFQEMLSETIQGASRPSDYSAGTNPIQVGLGMSVASVSQTFGQGQLQLTGNMMDMAVQGDGFFVLREGGQQFYGRAGAFGFDGDGRLTAGQGLLVQGWMANANGQIGSGTATGDIDLPFGQKSPARATQEIRLQSNLDASAQALSTITQTNPLLAQALSTDALQNLFNATGQDLGVQLGDSLNVRFAGTGDTAVTDLSVSGAKLDLVDGDTIVVTDGQDSANLIFDDSWDLSTFAAQIQSTLSTLGNETDVAVTVNTDGSLLFTNPSGGNNQDLTVPMFSLVWPYWPGHWPGKRNVVIRRWAH